MRFLTYRDLAPGDLAAKVDKVRAAIERDDFRSPDVKKLTGSAYCRAKLDDSSRLLLQFVVFQGQPACLALEVIRRHAYDKSRFLRGAAVDEARLPEVDEVAPQACTPLRYLHPDRPEFLILDKPLSLDDAQDAALRARPPQIIVGSAGSGKTALLLQRMRLQGGRVAYVTESRWLAESARALYIAFDGAPDDQEAEFLSYPQLIETIAVPSGRPVTFADFRQFFARHQAKAKFADAHAVFEEIRGVLTAEPEGVFGRADYLALGVKQSLFGPDERAIVYDLFTGYREWLVSQNLYEPNLVAHDLIARVEPTYEFLCIDEVQDLTNVQLALVLRTLKGSGRFVLAGDANQIVHPNYFAWAKVKSLFWRGIGEVSDRQIHMLTTSYRNSAPVTRAANGVLRLKHLRFGSIDRESNQLMRTVAAEGGAVAAFPVGSPALRELDQRTSLSTKVAVVVLRDEHKAEARKRFATPLLFSIHEAKGLEYETVILFRLVSAEQSIYARLADGLQPSDLQVDELEFRRSKDKTDKSLELYKFFVNALYVALTRAVRDVYLVEDDVAHPLLRLLQVSAATGAGGVQAVKATAEEWQREAHRLEAQGKRDQADDIRRRILKQVAVPWPVFDASTLPAALDKVTAPKAPPGKARDQLIEFAYFHGERPTVHRICRATGLAQAAFDTERPRHVRAALQRALGKGRAEILRDTERYGVDHRTQIGLTPLMAAAYSGDDALCRALVDRGADLTVRDHFGRQALHWAILGSRDGTFAKPDRLGVVWDLVAPPSFDVQSEGRMVQIGREMAEYFVFALLLARLPELWTAVSGRKAGIRAATLDDGWLAALPEAVWAGRRKKRAYLNSVLARAAVGSNYRPARSLWLRLRVGEYLPNPMLHLRAVGRDGEPAWLPIDDVVRAGWLDAQLGPREQKWARAEADALRTVVYPRELASKQPTPGSAAKVGSR